MSLRTALLLLALSAPALPQSNKIQGLDVALGAMDNLVSMGREGAFPNGVSGVAMSATSCNVGSLDVPWEEPMDPDHPFISFLVTREEGGRMYQISDYSFVKHGFFALTSSLCDQCTLSPFQGGDILGVGCSDTYSTVNNGDNFWLGPAEEIDPWLGIWDPVCSHFDAGEPSVPPPFDCDGFRSLTSQMASALDNGVGHRVNIADMDLAPGGDIYYQSQFIIESEPTEVRDDNLGSRACTTGWNGSSITFNTSGPLVMGSILNRWSGATVGQGGDGNDNGTFYVGVAATETSPGSWHYEVAVHNRDNSRGGGALRIPVPAGTTVTNPGFRDIDQNAGNDWTFQNNGTEIVFSSVGAELRWNSIYNFWFDADVAPGSGAVTVDHFLPGAGSAGVQVVTNVPGGDPLPPCGVTRYGTGLGAANIGTLSTSDNASAGQPFSIDLSGLNGNGTAFLAVVSNPTNTPGFGGTLLINPGLAIVIFNVPISGGAGSKTLTLPGAGITGYFQAAMPDGSQPAGWALTDGMKVEICP